MSPKRPLLAVVTAADKVQVWDWERRALVREWDGLIGTERIIPVGFSADGTELVATSVRADGASVRVWDLATGRENRSVTHPGGMASDSYPVLSPDGTQFIALRSRDAESVLVDLPSGRLTTHKLNLVQSSGPAFSPDGKLLVVPSSMGPVRIFDTVTYRETTTLSGFMFGTHGAGHSPDQQRLVIGGTAFEAVTLWDVHNYERLLTLSAPVGGIRVTFSPDGNVLAGGFNTLHFWRAPTWAEIEQAEAAERAGATK